MTDTSKDQSSAETAQYPHYPFPVMRLEDGDDINFVELWQSVLRRKFFIFFMTVLAGVISVYIAVTAEQKFHAKVLVAPVSQTNQGGPLGGLASQIADPITVAGMSLLKNGNEGAESTLAILTSRAFLYAFINDLSLKKELFPEMWNEEEQKFVPAKESVFSKLKSSVKSMILPPSPISGGSPNSERGFEPSDWDAYDRFIKLMRVDQQDGSSLYVVGIEWTDPTQAAEWANALVSRINKHVKQEQVRQADKSTLYLEAQLAKTTLLGMKEILYRLIEEQVKTAMLAEVRDDLAFTVLDPAVVPQERSAPRRGFIVTLGISFGLFGSIFLVLIQSVFSQKGRDQAPPEQDG